MWVSKDFGIVQNRTARHSGFLQHLEPVMPGLGGSHRLDLSGQLLAILHPVRIVYVLRAFDKVRSVDDLSTSLPSTLVSCTKSDVAVRTSDGLVWRKHPMGGSHRFRAPASREVLSCLPYGESNSRLQKGGVYVLPFASAEAVDVRSEDSLQREEPGAQ